LLGNDLIMLIEGKAALVTGGAGRIGRGIAATLRREGAAVGLLDSDPVRLEAVVAGLSAEPGPPVIGLPVDVTVPEAVERAVEAGEVALGGLDILVNAHGFVPNTPFLEMAVEEWDKVFAVNVRGTMLMCQTVARRWVARGAPGAIVNLSSGAGRSARRGSSHYCGSKAAVDRLTEVLAIEFGAHGIRVNAVSPGLVLDRVVRAGDNQHPYIATMLQATPLERTGAAEDIAQAVAFLASDRSAWTSGAILEVSGGGHCGRPHLPYAQGLGQASMKTKPTSG
jgi:NAD(P)-dependent dehydrogenase (short-subunit alcohol dehydrogenase family)